MYIYIYIYTRCLFHCTFLSCCSGWSLPRHFREACGGIMAELYTLRCVHQLHVYHGTSINVSTSKKIYICICIYVYVYCDFNHLPHGPSRINPGFSHHLNMHGCQGFQHISRCDLSPVIGPEGVVPTGCSPRKKVLCFPRGRGACEP